MSREALRRCGLLAIALAPVALWLLWPGSPEPRRAHDTRTAVVRGERAVGETGPEAPPTRGRLEGRVLHASGAPAADSEVLALAGEQIAARGRSGADGAWRLDDLPGGEYVLLARAGVSASAPLGPIPLTPGETLGALDLHLEPAASLAGTVRDAVSGEAIEGASLHVAGASSRTDRAGRFRLDALPPGPVTLRASAPGYEQRTQALTLAGRVSGLEIGLRRGGTLGGRVVGEGGPVAGAIVRAYRYGLGAHAPGEAAATSGADGSFSIEVPAGQVELEAVAPDGRRGRGAPVEVGPGARADGVDIRVERAAQLTGTVVDAAGMAAAGAEVQAVSLDGAGLAATTAGADGGFAFDGLPAGLLRLVARRGAAAGISPPVGLAAADVPHVEVRLGGGGLAGRVEDAHGAGIPGAHVIAWAEGAPRTSAVTATSDAGGRFRLDGLPDGPLRVEAVEGERRAEARGVLAGGDVRLVIGGGQLVGRVLVDGRPATDFGIAAASLDPGRATSASTRVLSADGTFRMPLPPGRYEVRASADEAEAVRQVVEVPGAGDSAEVVFELEAGGVVEGIVRDARTGAPLDGVRLSIARSHTYAFGQASDVPGEPRALTSADGTFRLGGLPTGRRVPVYAWKPGYQPVRPAIVQPSRGATERIEIVLAPGGDAASAFGGIGITLGRTRDALVAAEVIPGGPGWEAGIRGGDRIVAVEGVAVGPGDLRATMERVRGPVGTPVVLDLVRDGSWFRAAPVRAEIRF